jgi:autotransporter translocation and assembly factor TamB
MCLAMLLLGLGAYLARNPLRDRLARIASTWVSDNIQGTVEIGALRGSLFSSLVLRDVVLRNRAGAEVARWDELQLAYDLTALLSKRLRIRHVRLTRPRLTLTQEADGAWNLTQMFTSSAPATTEGGDLPLAIVLEQLQISDGQLALSIPSLPGVQRVEGLQVRLRGQVSTRGFRLDVQEFSAQSIPAEVELRTVRGVIEGEGQDVRLSAVRVQTARTQVTAEGLLPGGTRPASLTLYLQPFDVTELGRLLQREDIAGALNLSLTAEGPPDALTLHGQLSTEGSQLDWQARLNTSAQPWRYESRLGLTHVNLAALLHQEPLHSDLNLQLQVQGAGTTLETLRGTVRLDIQDSHLGSIVIQPSRLHAEIDQGRVEVQECDLRTSVARLMATGLLDHAGSTLLRYDLHANLADLQALLKTTDVQGQVHLQGQASGTLMALSTQGTLTAQRMQYAAYGLESLQVQYSGNPLGPQAQMTAHLALHRAVLDQHPVEHLRLEATYARASGQVQVSTEIVQSRAYHGKLHGQFAWTEHTQQLTLEELFVQLADRPWRLAAPVTVIREAAGLQMTPLQLTHADEAVVLAGAFDGVNFQDVRLQITRLDLTFLQRQLSLPEAIQGRVTGEAQLMGTLTAPAYDLAVQLQLPAQAYLPLDHVQGTLTYAQQRLQGKIHMQQGRRDVIAVEAQIPLDLALTPLTLSQRLLAEPLTLNVRVRQPEPTALARWQPTLPRLTGTVQGDVQIHGPYTALAVEAEVRFQQWGLAGSVQNVQGPLHLQATVGLLTPDASQIAPHVQRAILRVPSLRGQLPGAVPTQSPMQVQDLLLQMAGRWETAGFTGAIERAQAQIHLPGWPHTEFRLSGRATPQRLDLTELHVRLPQSEVRGHGTLTLPQQQVQLTLDIPRLRLDEVGAAWPAAWPPVVQGGVDIRGTLTAPQVETHWRYAGGQLHTALTAQLDEPVPRYQLTLRLDDLNLAALLPGEQGKLHVRAQVQGVGLSAAQRRAGLELHLETSGATPLPGLTAQLKANLAETTLALDRLQLRSTPLTITADGIISTTAKSALTYEMVFGDLTPLQRYTGEPVQAKGRLHGKLQGMWPALQAQSRLDLREWRYGPWHGQRVQTDLTVMRWPEAPQMTLKTQIVDLEGSALTKSTLLLTGTATPSQGTVQASVTAGPYHKTSLEGQFSLSTGQRFTLTRLHLQHQQGLVWDSAGPLTVVRQPQGALTLEGLVLRHQRQEIRVQGMLSAAGDVQADVQLQRVQLLPHLRAMALTGELIDGEVNAHLKVSGPLARLQGEGTLQLAALRWRQYEIGTINTQARFRDMSLGLELSWRDRKRELVSLAGEVGLADRQALNVQLRVTQFDTQILKTFSTAVTHSSGIVQADLRLTGTLRDPQLHGTVQLLDGALQLAATGVQYDNLQMQLVCRGTRIELTQLHATSGGGALDLSGWVERAGFTVRYLDLNLQMQQFRAMHTPELEAEVSAAMTVRGTLEDMLATGTVTIPKARMQIGGSLAGGPDAVQPWQLTVEGVYGAGPARTRTAATASKGAARDPLAFLRTDLQVELPRNVWVRGAGTAIELSGVLALVKERGAPLSLSGTVETVRGYASFYSGRFVVDQGRVTFTGSTEINPVLDITLTREVSHYVVSIHVGGRAQAPQLQLSSTPDLPQADIVTLLVVGKTTDRLTASERSGLSNRAQQIVGNVAAGELEQLLAKPLGLDTLDIQTGDKLGNGKVSVGRYITQDIFLSYERQLGNEGSDKVGVEYSINRHLKLKGSSSNTGDTALDILWRIDY